MEFLCYCKKTPSLLYSEGGDWIRNIYFYFFQTLRKVTFARRIGFSKQSAFIA